MEKIKKGLHPRPKFCRPQHTQVLFSILTEELWEINMNVKSATAGVTQENCDRAFVRIVR